jgi:flagellar hook-associated protein 2
MRIGGMASGMDIDSIVKDLMKAERIPLDKMVKKRQTLEWKRDDYRAMNTLLLDFRSELSQFKLTSKYRARQTTSANESLVSTTATSGASQGSYTINNVISLASAASRVSGSSGSNNEKLSKAGETFDPKAGLYSQTAKLDNGGTFTWSQGVIENQTVKAAADGTDFSFDTGTSTLKDLENMSVKVNGKSFEVVTAAPAEGLGSNQVLVDNTGNMTFGSTVKKDSSISVEYITINKTEDISTENPISSVQLKKGSISSLTMTVNGKDFGLGNTDAEGNTELKAADGEVIGTLKKETGKIMFADEQAAGTVITADYTQNYSSFSVGSHTKDGEKKVSFLVQGNESLNTVMSKVNQSDAGLTMFYDSFSDRVTMTRKETGDFNQGGDEISTSGDFINSLFKFGTATESGGSNLEFEINGLSTQRTSNTFEMNGVTFNIKQTFSTPNGVSTSVSNNTEDVFDNIVGFVNKYNELIGKINDKTSEEFYRSYGPLTDEEREAMTDKQVEMWEEKAKSGLLKRDSILTGALSKMRTDFYQPVENSDVASEFKQLASIGITTTPNYREGGKLVIDEAKLRKALEEDPTSVENLFRGGADSTTEAGKGIVNRLYDTVTGAMDSLKDKAGNSFSTNQQFSIGRELKNVTDRIDRFEDRLRQVEDRYWAQFTAMEKAVNKANSQSAYLMQQFSGGM